MFKKDGTPIKNPAAYVAGIEKNGYKDPVYTSSGEYILNPTQYLAEVGLERGGGGGGGGGARTLTETGAGARDPAGIRDAHKAIGEAVSTVCRSVIHRILAQAVVCS